MSDLGLEAMLPSLEQDYEAAWAQWERSSERDLWEGTAADGLVDAAR